MYTSVGTIGFTIVDVPMFNMSTGWYIIPAGTKVIKDRCHFNRNECNLQLAPFVDVDGMWNRNFSFRDIYVAWKTW